MDANAELMKPSHIEIFERQHADDINELFEELDENIKGLFLIGPVHSGKTSLALAVTRALQQQYGKEKSKAIFTTPATQNTFGAKNIIDRTGVLYQKLPSPDELARFDGKVVIIIDEATNRSLDTSVLGHYVNLPNVQFMVLLHPDARNRQSWLDMFKSYKIQQYDITAEKAA